MASTFIALPSVASNGPIDVVVNSSNDSILVAGNNSSSFAEITALASGATATVISVLFAAEAKLRKVHISGANRAEYELRFNTVVQDKCRTTLQNYNIELDYETGLTIPAGTTVDIQVTNAGPGPGDFNALLLYSPT